MIMKSKKLFITAFATLMAMVITSCTNDMGNGDNPNSGITDIAELEGCWYNDVTGMTSAMWTYGECTQVTAFNSDGTGLIDVYYNRDEQPVAREHHAFTYTAQTDGTLTMELDSLAEEILIDAFHTGCRDVCPLPKTIILHRRT